MIQFMADLMEHFDRLLDVLERIAQALEGHPRK